MTTGRAIACLSFGVLTACHDADVRPLAWSFDGDPARGQAAIAARHCGVCHQIPGVVAAHGVLGTPLAGIRRRAFIAGQLPNDFGNMVRWIEHPRAIRPATVMPDLGLSRAEAQDVAAYLYTLD